MQQEFSPSEESRRLFNEYWESVRHAREQGKYIAYCSPRVPREFLLGQDVVIIVPSNTSATCGVRKVATQCCEIAEEHGYFPELCSYARTDLGSELAGEKTPSILGQLPKPDFLVCAGGFDHIITKWFECISRIFNVPLFIIEFPYRHDNPSPDETRNMENYFKEQYLELILFLERMTGRPFDYDGFCQSIAYSNAMEENYQELLNMKANIPSPLTIWDMQANYVFPYMVLRGLPQGAEFYKAATEYVRKKAERKEAAVPNEKYRLHWNALPIWFMLGHLSRKFASHGASLVSGPYEPIISIRDVDPNRVLETLAKTAIVNLPGGTRDRVDYLVTRAEKYHLDGLVMQWSRTCKVWTIGLRDIIDEVEKRIGIPGVLLEGDTCDERLVNRDVVDATIDSFMEVLESRKKAV